MLNVSFLACTNVELWDMTVHIAEMKKKLRCDLELCLTMSNIEFV